jgi:hypothetical protein
MVERICPQCHFGNPLEHRFCGRCGISLERNQLAPPPETGLNLSNLNVPDSLKQVGQAMAVSLVALAAEAGMAWLRRRVNQIGQQPITYQTTPVTYQQVPAATQPTSSSIVPTVAVPPASEVTVHRHRVVQVWEHGVLTHQSVERTTWSREL